MAEDEKGGKQVSFSLDLGKLVPAAMLVITVVLGVGVYQTAQALDQRVQDLEVQVEQLEGFAEQLTAVQSQINTVRADVTEISRARDDILGAICRILERPLDQCGIARPPLS